MTRELWIPSGKLLHNYGKSPFLMGKSTVNPFLMGIHIYISTIVIINHGPTIVNNGISRTYQHILSIINQPQFPCRKMTLRIAINLKCTLTLTGNSEIRIWQCVKTLVPLVNIKIAGKWMFIPLKMVCIGIDP
jgi:hypothetical protein